MTILIYPCKHCLLREGNVSDPKLNANIDYMINMDEKRHTEEDEFPKIARLSRFRMECTECNIHSSYQSSYSSALQEWNDENRLNSDENKELINKLEKLAKQITEIGALNL